MACLSRLPGVTACGLHGAEKWRARQTAWLSKRRSGGWTATCSPSGPLYGPGRSHGTRKEFRWSCTQRDQWKVHLEGGCGPPPPNFGRGVGLEHGQRQGVPQRHLGPVRDEGAREALAQHHRNRERLIGKLWWFGRPDLVRTTSAAETCKGRMLHPSRICMRQHNVNVRQ